MPPRDNEDQNVDGGIEIELGSRDRAVIHGVKRTGHTRQKRGDHKRLHPESSDIDAHGFGSDPVVPDGLDCPALPGVDQVLHNKQGEQNQHKTHGKGGQLGNAGGASGAGDVIIWPPAPRVNPAELMVA